MFATLSRHLFRCSQQGNVVAARQTAACLAPVHHVCDPPFTTVTVLTSHITSLFRNCISGEVRRAGLPPSN